MTAPGDQRPVSSQVWPAESDWAGRSPLDSAARYEAAAPVTHVHFLAEDAALARHQRHLAWANLGLRLAGMFLGGAVVAGMIALSWHAVDANETQQVKWIIGTPAVLLTGVFVTGRTISVRTGRSRPEDGGGTSPESTGARSAPHPSRMRL